MKDCLFLIISILCILSAPDARATTSQCTKNELGILKNVAERLSISEQVAPTINTDITGLAYDPSSQSERYASPFDSFGIDRTPHLASSLPGSAAAIRSTIDLPLPGLRDSEIILPETSYIEPLPGVPDHVAIQEALTATSHGQFQIVNHTNPIGEGGTTRVYEAIRVPPDGRRYVVGIMRPSNHNSSQIIAETIQRRTALGERIEASANATLQAEGFGNDIRVEYMRPLVPEAMNYGVIVMERAQHPDFQSPDNQENPRYQIPARFRGPRLAYRRWATLANNQFIRAIDRIHRETRRYMAAWSLGHRSMDPLNPGDRDAARNLYTPLDLRTTITAPGEHNVGWRIEIITLPSGERHERLVIQMYDF